jgi:hypothetical protein
MFNVRKLFNHYSLLSFFIHFNANDNDNARFHSNFPDNQKKVNFTIAYLIGAPYLDSIIWCGFRIDLLVLIRLAFYLSIII